MMRKWLYIYCLEQIVCSSSEVDPQAVPWPVQSRNATVGPTYETFSKINIFVCYLKYIRTEDLLGG